MAPASRVAGIHDGGSPGERFPVQVDAGTRDMLLPPDGERRLAGGIDDQVLVKFRGERKDGQWLVRQPAASFDQRFELCFELSRLAER